MRRFDISGVRLGLIILSALVIGGFAGAFAWSSFFGDDAAPERGTIVKLGGPDSLSELDSTPFCVPSQHFCIVKLQYGRLIALYTYDTHPYFRSQGCEIKWLPDFSFPDPSTAKDSTGWFRSGCSGTTYRMDGEQVFGPGARDMDRFALAIVDGPGDLKHIEVDTRQLICGAGPAPRDGCEWAPLPQ